MKPSPADPAFKKYVVAGLKALAASPTLEARRTLKAITSGRVKIDGFSDLTAADFKKVRRDVPGVGAKLDARANRAISKALDGYMWDDRVYVHRDLSPVRLASVLVHEVTHVLMKSEENYRGPKAALLQEYAAFYAEKRFRGVEMTPEKCRALKREIIESYGLKGVQPEDVPDQPQVRVTPRARSSAARASR
ncbi:MAG: hypothetical protein JNK82_06755 [Myxococcaceae bacterium]|nr:hypothetical protein [Myxococcaceae bacterium]